MPLMTEARALQLAPAFADDKKARLAKITAEYNDLVAKLWGTDPAAYTPMETVLAGLRERKEQITYYGYLYEMFAPRQTLKDIFIALKSTGEEEAWLVNLQGLTMPPHAWFAANNVEANEYLDQLFNLVYGPAFIKQTADAVLPVRFTELEKSLNAAVAEKRVGLFTSTVSLALDARQQLAALADTQITGRADYAKRAATVCDKARDQGLATAQALVGEAAATEDPLAIADLLKKAEAFLGAVRQIEPAPAGATELEQRIAQERKRGEELYAKMADRNRVPRDNYAGNDIETVRARVKAAFQAKKPGVRILRVTVTMDPWERAEWSGDGDFKGWFQYVEAAVAYVDPEIAGEYNCWVAQSNYRRPWSGTSYNTSFTLDFTHTRYPIREANAEK